MALATRTFRIFVSSTFSDLVAERNALRERVFPALKQLCAEASPPARFQDVDLRWGVSEEAQADQQTMNICLGEVDRCREISPRPNFIVLLGDRYGWRPIPPQIDRAEFDGICDRVGASKADRLRGWYVLDENAVPPVYDLQPRTGEFKDYAKWECEERQLRDVFLEGTAGWSTTDERRRKYEASATEQEIWRGALGSPDAHEHVFCFFRTIEGLPRDASAARYIDLDPCTEQPEEEGPERLRTLKAALAEHLPGHVKTYTARWKNGAPTAGHLKQLCDDVLEALSGVITQQLAESQEEDKLEKEVRAHEDFGRERAKIFVGRDEILREISEYLAATGARPLAVAGVSGSGKSALVARAAQAAGEAHPGAQVVMRFVGVTPDSTDGRRLLISLCQQISRGYGQEQAMPTDWRELVEELPKRLALATADRPLIVFLDALDQLSDVERARSLAWLPAELPEHVHVVVSTLVPEAERRAGAPRGTGIGEPLRALRAKLGDAVLTLEPMKVEEGEAALTDWLGGAGRTLKDSQRREVMAKFAEVRLPLYLRLAFEEARRWKSYTPDKETKLASGVEEIIRRNLFARLSLPENHGKILVSQSLGYLAAAKYGLSEDEIVDALSADEDVLEEFNRRAERARQERLTRLPVVLWSRLFLDLEPYLTERAAEGGSLMGFYHRQLAEVATKEFLEGPEGKERRGRLARYFKSRQPFTNLRTLAELPYQLTMAEMWDDLFETLTNFEFLERKAADLGAVTATDAQGNSVTTYTGIYLIHEDFELALDEMPGDGERRGRIGERPLILTAIETDGRLWARCPACLTELALQQADLDTVKNCDNTDCGRALKLNPHVVKRGRVP